MENEMKNYRVEFSTVKGETIGFENRQFTSMQRALQTLADEEVMEGTEWFTIRLEKR